MKVVSSSSDNFRDSLPMRLAVFSHKLCWRSVSSDSGYSTDGGFPLQMGALSEIFSSVRILVPCEKHMGAGGLLPLSGNQLSVVPLSLPHGSGVWRKLFLPVWFARNCRVMVGEFRRADAIHTPIPSDIGTIGLVLALIFRKPLFVRHCGNWFVQRTFAERFWKWAMERFGGGRNVMLATGGAVEPPSCRNHSIKWIFSTSLRSAQMSGNSPRRLPSDGRVRLIIACRQERGKGTEVVIESLPLLLKTFPQTTLDIVGDGSNLSALRDLVVSLRLNYCVTFHGKVEQVKVLDLLRNADVFCFPTASEGFPKAVLEALAFGLPVITTRVSVLPILIGLGGGKLLDQITATDLASAVIKICSNGEEYSSISRKAISTAKEFTLENWRDQIRDELRRAWEVPDCQGPTKRS